MLRIYVLSQDGGAPASALAAVFEEGHGSIGRDAHNTLVLPDPHKHISRVQAQIRIENGCAVLVDQGANPTSVNGRPLGKGSMAPLHDGDSIGMAGWVLRVEEQRARPVLSAAPPAYPSSVPNADPLGLLAADTPSSGSDPLGLLGAGRPPSPMSASAPPLSAASPFVQPSMAPVMPPRAQASNPDDPFAVFVTADTPAAPSAQVQQSADPFAAFAPPVQPPASPIAPQAHSSDPLGLGISQGGGESLDALFGLGSSPANDLFAQSALAEPDFQAPSGDVDPLALLMGTSGGSAQPVMRQDSPVLSDAFVPPRPISAGEPQVSAPPPPATPPVPAPGASQDALMAAFLRGVGMPGFNLQGAMTEEFAEHLGSLLREAVQGTVELLAARAVTKHEMKAAMTMIVSAHNNPLKFSPDVAFALHLLFQQQARQGFMGPVEAMRDAYDDLRAHQLGLVAGMRAAFEGVLVRFQPEELEGRLSDKSFLDSVLPANRKAKLWSLYEQRYRDVLREAEDDFNSLFGREFLRAYEEQIDNLQKERKDRS